MMSVRAVLRGGLALHVLAGLLLAGWPSPALAFDGAEEEMFGGRPQQGEQVRQWDEENAAKYTDPEEVLLLPGLAARRKQQRVEVMAERTSLRAHEAGEYLVVGADSSHGYEALFWAHARPRDIHKALEFIGVRAGTPRDPRALRFWARGERIRVTVAPTDDPDAIGAPRIEQLIFDMQTDTTLPEEGFIFSGSLEVSDPARGLDRVYLADAYDPFSIIPAYNEPASVLDVPWQATKGEFYEHHVMNPEFAGEANELVLLVFEPQDPNGRARMRDLVLEVSASNTFRLLDPADGKVLNDEATLSGVLMSCRELVEAGQEPYVTVRFDPAMTLETMVPVARVVAMIEQIGGLRVEPPQPGQLFYKALLPEPEWRDAAGRLMQPWELHLRRDGDGLAGSLVIHEQEWREGQMRPDLTPRRFEAPTPQSVPERLAKYAEERASRDQRTPPAALLVYAPPDLTYGALIEFIGPVIQTVNTVHLFLEQTPPAETAADAPTPADVPAQGDGAQP